MRTAQEILIEYGQALEANDMLAMVELIEEMKETDPVYVALMINSAYEDEDEEYYDEEDEDYE